MGNKIKCEIYGFEQLIEKLDEVNGNIKNFVTETLESVGEDVGVYTKEAVEKSNLPAGGKYSKGDTEKSVIMNPPVEWNALTASVKVGFDYSKPGAGGLLISGTPRMKPAQSLVSIYKRKKFWKEISEGINDSFNDYLDEAMKE